MNGPGLSGLNCSTPNNLVLDAGALYFNIDETAFTHNPPYDDPVTQALANATLAGATRGGATFETGKETRHVEVDGMRYPIKGLERIDGYTPTLTVTMIEMSAANLQRLLGSSTATTLGNFTTIDLSAEIASTDYITNVALVTTLSGSEDPVILVLRNVLMTESASLAFEDKSEAGIEATFTAHVSPCSPYTSPVTLYVPRTGTYLAGTYLVSSSPGNGDTGFSGSTLTMAFSGPLDQTAAESVLSYVVTELPSTTLTITSASYNNSNYSVTLTLSAPVSQDKDFELASAPPLVDFAGSAVEPFVVSFDSDVPVS